MEAQDYGTVRVTGEGKATAFPDTARITVGVQLRGADRHTVREEAGRRMNDVIAALVESGIDRQKIRTKEYSIDVLYRDTRSRDQIRGYQLTHVVQAPLTDLDQVGAVTDRAISAGANIVRQVEFYVEDTREALRAAREQAMADAHERARQLAQLGGITLGLPVHISEHTSRDAPRDYVYSGREVAFAAAGPVEPSPIEPGETTLAVSVNVVFPILEVERQRDDRPAARTTPE